MPRLLSSRLVAAHALVVVLAAAAGALGLWQYGVWHDHRSAAADDLTRSAPEPLDSVIGPDEAFPGGDVGQPVELSGTWVPAATVFVSGREHDGVEGYWVVTPVAIGAADGSAVPVVRGWIPDPAQASAPPTGATRLVGWLQPPDGADLPDDDPSDDVLPQLRIADLLQRLDQDLYGAYVVARADPTAVNDGSAGLVPGDLAQLPPAGTFTSVRNLLYALEWWVFGGFAVFIWWRFVRDELQAVDEHPVPSEP